MQLVVDADRPKETEIIAASTNVGQHGHAANSETETTRKPIPRGLRAAGAVALIACVTVLTGCENFVVPGDIFVKREGNALLVTVCSDIQAELISIGKKNEAAGEKSEDLLRIESAGFLKAGTQISTSTYLSAGESQPRLNAGDELYVIVSDNDKDDPAALYGAFLIGEDGLSDQLWLSSDGTETAEPCA